MNNSKSYLGAALASLLAVAGCAGTGQNRESGAESPNTSSVSDLKVENRQGGTGVTVSMEPGPQGGLRIPEQLIVPEVKPKKQGDGAVQVPVHEL